MNNDPDEFEQQKLEQIISTYKTCKDYRDRVNAISLAKRNNSIVTKRMKDAILIFQEFCCGLCGKKHSLSDEVDHIIRRTKGGSNRLSNLMLLCTICHGYKTDMENLRDEYWHDDDIKAILMKSGWTENIRIFDTFSNPHVPSNIKRI